LSWVSSSACVSEVIMPVTVTVIMMYHDFTVTSALGLNFLLASAYCTRAHTLSLDSYCRPTSGKSSSPAGLSTLVYAYVVDRAPASPDTYSSSTHRFPDERTPLEATPLSATSAERGLGLGVVLELGSLEHFYSHALPFFSPPSFHSHNIPFPRIH
jgi:hypothetical protein